MHLDTSVQINAPPDKVWAILINVERWPEWTDSMTAVKRLDATGFGVGSRVQIKQPKLPPTLWRVTAFEPGRSFDWVASSPGAKTTARHHIEPLQGGPTDGGCLVTLSIDQTGLLGGFIAFFLKKLTQRYVDMEAQGLKRRAEGV